MRISDWSSDVCSSDLPHHAAVRDLPGGLTGAAAAHRARPRQDPQHVEAGGHPRRRPPGEAGVRAPQDRRARQALDPRSEEHTSELQSLMRRSYAVFFLQKTKVYRVGTITKITRDVSH